ncbi:MAG: DUF342 domain-containing protein [Chthonomonadaceae bacterium]|nr:DUF342 domain-containing protein [Chthonomonadaceae bacterium]
MSDKPRDGFIEVRFNIDQSQAFANIYPPGGKGEEITLEQCLSRLRAMGAMHGFRENAIKEAIALASTNKAPVMDIVVAQGELVRNGEDAQVRYIIPKELVVKPLPKFENGQVDWFTLDPQKMVKAGVEVAAVVPATLGAHGKTITWPIQMVHAEPGRTARLFAGQGVRASQDGLHLFAIRDGYLYQQGEQMIVVSLHCHAERLCNADMTIPEGVVLLEGAETTKLKSGGLLAIDGKSMYSQFRAQEDVIIRRAENCQIIAAGNVYVLESLVNCTVITPQHIYSTEGAVIQGGRISATEGVEVWSLGSESGETTEVAVGMEHFFQLRAEEIEKEIQTTESNSERIRQAIKPFQTVAAHSTLTEERLHLLHRLQAEEHSQKLHVNALRNERRQMQFFAKQKASGTITVRDTLYSGVLVHFGETHSFIAKPLHGVKLRSEPHGAYHTELLAA